MVPVSSPASRTAPPTPSPSRPTTPSGSDPRSSPVSSPLIAPLRSGPFRSRCRWTERSSGSPIRTPTPFVPLTRAMATCCEPSPSGRPRTAIRCRRGASSRTEPTSGLPTTGATTPISMLSACRASPSTAPRTVPSSAPSTSPGIPTASPPTDATCGSPVRSICVVPVCGTSPIPTPSSTSSSSTGWPRSMRTPVRSSAVSGWDRRPCAVIRAVSTGSTRRSTPARPSPPTASRSGWPTSGTTPSPRSTPSPVP